MESSCKKRHRKYTVCIEPGVIAGWIHQHIQGEFKSKLRHMLTAPKRIGIDSDRAG